MAECVASLALPNPSPSFYFTVENLRLSRFGRADDIYRDGDTILVKVHLNGSSILDPPILVKIKIFAQIVLQDPIRGRFVFNERIGKHSVDAVVSMSYLFKNVIFPYESYYDSAEENGGAATLRHFIEVKVGGTVCKRQEIHVATPVPEPLDNPENHLTSICAGRWECNVDLFKKMYAISDGMIFGRYEFRTLSNQLMIKGINFQLVRRTFVHRVVGQEFVLAKDINLSQAIKRFTNAGPSIWLRDLFFVDFSRVTPTYENVYNRFHVKYFLKVSLMIEKQREQPLVMEEEVVLYRPHYKP